MVENARAIVFTDGEELTAFCASRIFFFKRSFSFFLLFATFNAFLADLVTGIKKSLTLKNLPVVLAQRGNYTGKSSTYQ